MQYKKKQFEPVITKIRVLNQINSSLLILNIDKSKFYVFINKSKFYIFINKSNFNVGSYGIVLGSISTE